MQLTEAITTFLDSISKSSVYSELTIRCYVDCLSSSPRNLKWYCAGNQIADMEQLNVDVINGYRELLVNSLSTATIARYMTSIRQFLTFCNEMGWCGDFWRGISVPSRPLQRMSAIRAEVSDAIMKLDFGRMPVEILRNRLIFSLFLNLGLSVKECSGLEMDHIEKFGEQQSLTVRGKSNKKRIVIIDQATWGIMMEYGPLREDHLTRHKLPLQKWILIDLQHRSGPDLRLKACGIQAVIRRMRVELCRRNPMWNASSIKPTTLKYASDAKYLRGMESYKEIFIVERRQFTQVRDECFLDAAIIGVVSSKAKATNLIRVLKAVNGQWFAITSKVIDGIITADDGVSFYNHLGEEIVGQPVDMKGYIPRCYQFGVKDVAAGMKNEFMNAPVDDGAVF